jgi:hypothetical protein
MSELNLHKNASGSSGVLQSYNEYQDYEYDYEYDEEDLNNKISDENVVFIEEADILNEREKMILEATEKLFLERNQAILAMIYY